MIGTAACDRAHDVERIERRDARARLGNVEPRVGQIEPLLRGAKRELQQQALGVLAVVLVGQTRQAPGADRRAAAGLRADAAERRARPAPGRNHPERPAARLVRRADIDTAVPA